jgi:hypothetical protein
VLITGNYIYGAPQAAITVYGGYSKIENNHIENTDFSSTTNGASIWIFDGATAHVGTNRFKQSSLVANSFAVKPRAGAIGVISAQQFTSNIGLLSNLSGGTFRALPDTAAAQVNSTAVDVAGVVADFNALLVKLRSAGIIFN